jgi:hypothetical protein
VSDLLGGLDGWRMQMGVWHYAVQGDIGETSALIAEGNSALLILGEPWDRTAADLEHHLVSYEGRPYERVKDSTALPWVTEHILRGHAAWTGLAEAPR